MTIEPVVGEVGRFFCESGSNPGARHMVDLLEGQCGCASYVCRRAAYERERGRPYRCKHLVATREYFLDQVLEAVKNGAK